MDYSKIKNALEITKKTLVNIRSTEFSTKNLEKALLSIAQRFSGDRGEVLWPLRVALSGKEKSPPPFEIAAILGKQKTLNRIKQAITKITPK